MYNSKRADYQPNSSTTYTAMSAQDSYSVPMKGARPAGCCGKGCCWWGKKQRGME